jgi:hypothetical protein
MKRFLSTVFFCLSLLIFGIFVFLPSSKAEDNLLLTLLNFPAPPPPNPLIENNFKARAENFYHKNNSPPDDAPIDDLLDYWRHQNQYDAKYTYAPKPSEKSLHRIIAEIEKDPEQLREFLNVLPDKSESVEFVKRLYDREVAAREYGREWRDPVRRWLTYHSSYFSDELLKGARQAADVNDYVSNQNEVLALARVDWEKARPILDRLINDSNQPVSQTLARWAFYERALREGDSAGIEKYRRELQQTVENRNGKPGDRDLAMDALVEAGDFDGRDDWYLSLLEDESLLELRVGGQVYTGLTTLLNHSPSDKYVAKMLELVKSENRAARSAAARNLITLLNQKNPDIVRALLPWLEDARWAREVGGERRMIVDALQSLQIPESVPGLIAVLNEKAAREIPSVNANANTVATVYSSNSIVTTGGAVPTEYYPYRYSALNALAAQKSAQAIPALRALLLTQTDDYERRLVVKALLLSGGFSVAEQVEALEAIARNSYAQQQQQGGMMTANAARADDDAIVMMSGGGGNTSVITVNTNIAAPQSVAPWTATDSKAILGFQVIGNSEPTDELVFALLDRVNALDEKEPSVARAMRKIIQNWNGAAVNSMLLRDLKNNKADADAVVKLLSLRRELREKQINEIYELRGEGGSFAALGFAACLLEDDLAYDAILAGESAEAKIALLACARLIRAELPVQKAAENLRGPNKLLALAAESYLASEDSPEARQIVLALHPNKAKILGARMFFAGAAGSGGDGFSFGNNAFLNALFASVASSSNAPPPPQQQYYLYDYSEEFAPLEKKLQKEVLENQELLGIYAYDDNFIRVYKDRAVFSWEEDQARYRERVLTKDEFDRFKDYLTASRVDDLPPFLAFCSSGLCEAKQLLMLGRDGGRRVFVRGGGKRPKFFAELVKIFADFRRAPAELRYWLSKEIPGLEILFADENLKARAVWKNGADFRVLIDDETRRRRVEEELERQNEDEAQSPDYDDEKAQERIVERRRERLYENFAWYKFAPPSSLATTATSAAHLTEPAAQPPQIEFIPAAAAARGNLSIPAAQSQWKARAGGFEIRADADGLYKIAGGRATKIRSGYYEKPLVTPDGRWALAAKYGDEEPPALVRVNLSTGGETKIRLAQYPTFEAVAFIPSLNKALVFGGVYGDEEYEAEEEIPAVENGAAIRRSGDYFLLDAATGAAAPVKGEIRPLAQQTFRALQPIAGGKPDEFWAAIPDADRRLTEFGVYNARTLAFRPLLKVPRIVFGSMETWIDGSKIYFVYEGHLLALALPK